VGAAGMPGAALHEAHSSEPCCSEPLCTAAYGTCSTTERLLRLQGIPPAAVGKVSSPSLQELIRQCIAFNPRDRPTARQLLKHPFFDSIRWGAA
jgi:serine/threonine protein kinase